ncbi:MAG: PD-(D/E)XK nuclease family protein [Nanoarchaeota archaeon]|nr:PD-(D/E)XK nuclease family protein [Nanoarchaeota archaeon]
MLYSHSRLAAFEQCQLKFKYRYLDQEKAALQSVEAFLGQLVHKTLEKLYRDVQHQKHETLEELLVWYAHQWEKQWEPTILIVRKDYTAENYKKMGEEFIRRYWERHHPFNSTYTIGLESRVTLALDSAGEYQLQGYIDRIATTDDGVYEIHDYKTGGHIPIVDALKQDRQLALYALAIKTNYQDVKEIKLVWHYLAFNKDIVLTKTDDELDQLRTETIDLIKRIEATNKFPPKVSALCDWCEFRPICPTWKHEYKTEQLEPNEFLQEDGVSLVNKYIELSEKKRLLTEDINGDLEKLKEAILEYARREGMTTLRGSDHRVKIWEKDVWSFPARDDPRRQELEQLLKRLGIWNDVAALDSFALSRAIDEGKWPKELIDKITAFGALEHKERLYPRKVDFMT